ncbi:CNTLN-like protein [Mya arenaria]|uniref:CNTLN-like protein n=2 Tax=Mya arenaria TaxID=6604 RepID=A0ABY7DXG7_MYAAR|nr:CNTLN-like protein [Mya arenaria]
MEEMATRQMKSLARESEDALETAKDKLREIHQVLQAYQRFVRNLAAEILRRTQQARAAVKEQDQRRAACERENISLKRAQNLAKDILNLSQSDLDEIMSADGDHTNMESESEVERRRDRKWAKKVDRTQNGKDDFALALMDLFLQKIEERHELMGTARPAGESPMT